MTRRPLGPGAALASLLAGSCGSGEPPVEPRFTFQDATAESGLGGFAQTNGSVDKPFIVETVGAGVALLDFDSDGDLDAYLTNGGRLEPGADDEVPRDALYVNDGAGVFTDGTAAAGLGDTGWTNGVRVVDLDGDGAPDLFLTSFGPNVLYRNRGGGFEDVTAEAGVGDERWSTGAAFLDHDRDGDLDLYVANYLDFDSETILRERPRVMYSGLSVMKGPRGLPGSSDIFYVNEGAWRFRDASSEVGIDGPELFGFQAVTFDVDRDGWMDVYVANDSVANLLWHNVEGRSFEDRAVLSGLAFSMSGKEQAGMGVAVGDYDGDLNEDLFVTNFHDDYFTLYRGSGNGYFVDVTQRTNLSLPTKPMLGWGCGFADFDSDGVPELFAVNGHVYPQVDEVDLGTEYQQRNQLFEFVDGTFGEPPGGAGPGFELKRSSRGAAVGDIDGDGDLDLLVGNIDQSPTLLRNDTPSGNWLSVRVVGRGANRDAVGARIVVSCAGRSQLRLVGSCSSFLSSSGPQLHFGLGASTSADAVEVTWPDGEVTTLRDVPAGQLLTVER